MFSRFAHFARVARPTMRVGAAATAAALGGAVLAGQTQVASAETLYDKVSKLAAAVDALEKKAGGVGGVSTADLKEVVDLTAANIAANTLALAKMGDIGLMAAAAAVKSGKYRVAKPVKLVAPINGVGKIVCIGMNYVEHCTEQNMPVPVEPVVFNKFPNTICGSGTPIDACAVETQQMDFEVELAVVVGSVVPRHITPAQADQYILGYTVAHDVSARDWQLKKNGGQWLLGKTFDNYAPIGPAIVTKGSIDPNNVAVKCRVNGETLQDGHTREFVFTPQFCLAWLSRFVTMEPGDLIFTGTPSGVGCFRKPPIWLKAGDVVECEIEGIGVISNPIV